MKKTLSARGLALLKQFEGFSATSYICPGGMPTIGYDHVIKASESFPEAGISQNEAEILLKQDVSLFESEIDRLVTVTIGHNQFDALVCFAYNIGIQAFEKSTLLRLLNEGEAPKAALEFKKWVFSKGRRLPGLVSRRNAEANLFNKNLAFTKL